MLTEHEMLEVLVEVGTNPSEYGRLIWMEITNKASPAIVQEAIDIINASRKVIEDGPFSESLKELHL